MTFLLFLLAFVAGVFALACVGMAAIRFMQGDEIWRRALVVAAISGVAALVLWSAGAMAKAGDDSKAEEVAAAAKVEAKRKEAAEQVAAQKQAVLDEKQLKIDTRAAEAAGQSVDLYRAVKDNGLKGYAGELCRNAAINAATFGWDADQPFNGPSVKEENAEAVLLVGHDIRYKNGFGAEGSGSYSCSVDKRTGSIMLLDHGIDPGAGG